MKVAKDWISTEKYIKASYHLVILSMILFAPPKNFSTCGKFLPSFVISHRYRPNTILNKYFLIVHIFLSF